MATGVTVYRNTDSSAPTLSGTAGDLVNLFDKCLVTGYGSKAAAGWSKPYTGTNTAVFRMGGGNQFYLNLDDNSPGAGGATEARARGYEVMTAVGTGTGLFPTVAQVTNGIIPRKSAAANATTRSWVVVADDRTVYLYVLTADTANVYLSFMFGDFYSYLASDNYRTMIAGRITENNGSASDFLSRLAPAKAALSGHFVARNYTGLGTSAVAGKYGDSSVNNTALTGNITFPNPVDGGLYGSPCFLYVPDAATIRGQLRGFWHQLHTATGFADFDTVSGSGRTFTFLKQTIDGSSAAFLMETSDTWDTNV